MSPSVQAYLHLLEALEQSSEQEQDLALLEKLDLLWDQLSDREIEQVESYVAKDRKC